MPPITENTRFSFRAIGWVSAFGAAVYWAWTAGIAWAAFMASFTHFQDATLQHFARIEKTLEATTTAAGVQASMLAAVRAKQDAMTSDRWTERDMREWTNRLDRENRALENGKGLSVPAIPERPSVNHDR